ncbi:MAG: bifunctional (p)ppGpp synthetase/guanosine-3',5'-bis(diphosphate) 3'-pyrophosphohydrolase [Desulfovibrio sp.]|nr:bifunctional (p)ppGpp synthetase/guanosine-3',5'-bis(diphosphate) 3'-pyrophosphohydrolase [Desulfovibrio sp.]
MRTADMNLRQMAWRFAAERHGEQQTPVVPLRGRGGMPGLAETPGAPGMGSFPYLFHVGAVVMETQEALVRDPTLNADLALCCACLHDVIEDTGTTREEVAELFGDGIAAGVAALSKDPDLHGLEAIRDSLRRIRLREREIWVVKLADRCTNLGGPPPVDWTREMAIKYAEEGEIIRQTLRTASPWLDARLAMKIRSWLD